jgi:DNA repair protein RadC
MGAIQKGRIYMPIKMKQLPISERPYEKLEMYGENTLSNAELLAIIIKSGTKEESSVTLAQKILSLGKQNNFNQDSFTFLQELSINELMQIKRNRQSKSNSNKSCM